MIRRLSLLAGALLVIATNAAATTFIVPDDAELVSKSEAIVTGVVLSATAREVEGGMVETEYEIAVDSVLKGPITDRTRIRITSPGGVVDGMFSVVHSAAHFKIDDEVLLFLSRHRGNWTPTDLTLGKFILTETSRGYSVAVRDEHDIAGWDRDGRVHKEKVRLEAEFLQFIRDAVGGHKRPADYEVEAEDVLAEPSAETGRPIQVHAATFPAATYAVKLQDCALNNYPGRWETATMNAGIAFFKNATQNASGVGDGGVSIIQNGLAAWTNDCESAVNITYGGTDAAVRAIDGKAIVLFNDPNGNVPGSWGGSGTVAITFSNGGFTHSFGGTTFVTFSDSDIVFQNGFPGNHAAMNTAMTHEIGHAIGIRHSDRHNIPSCSLAEAPCTISCSEVACDGLVEECGATAIMTAAANGALGFTLQTYDKNAANALYPASCASFTPPTNVVATATSGTNVSITWNAVVGATNYRVHRASAHGSFTTEFNAGSSTNFTDTTAVANTSYQYVVRAGDGVTYSTFSDDDIATTVVFTDSTLDSSTTVKVTHFNEMLTAVNALRTLVALTPISFTAPTPAAGVTTRKVHVDDLRTALSAARGVLGFSTSFAETLTAGTTTVKASHVTEIRSGVQ